jgi:hypothetical protein
MSEAEPSGHLPPPQSVLAPPVPAPPTSRFGPSPTLEELFPPVESVPSFWKRHRRGLIIGFVVLAVAVGVVVYQVWKETHVTQAKVGDCLIGELGVIEVTSEAEQIVDCAKPHTREVYAIGSTDKHVSLVPAPIDPELLRICRTDVDPEILQKLGAVGNLKIGFLISTDRTGKVTCFALGPERTGSDLNLSG